MLFGTAYCHIVRTLQQPYGETDTIRTEHEIAFVVLSAHTTTANENRDPYPKQQRHR